MKLEDIYTKYDEAFQFLQTRKRRQAQQLVLLNNLQRGDENIASTMLITLLTRMASNLYDDKLQIKFVPGEEVDQRMVNSLNLLAQNDYREMGMPKKDYDWIWDTLFFGRGYMETLQWDKTRRMMKPEVINPLMLGYDPYPSEKKNWRYYWKWITRNKYELQKLQREGVIDANINIDDIPSGMEPYLYDYKVTRDRAKLASEQPIDPANGDIYQILEFYGYNDDGKKCVTWTDKDISMKIMERELDLGVDDEDDWPIVIMEAFREPHSSVPFSVADLLEDKHRAKSVILNLALMAAKDNANPLYGYNPDKIRDVSQLFSRQLNQHIPMESEDAMWPLQTKDPMPPALLSFLAVLQQEANDPVGTGISLQPAKKGQQTATEAAIQQQLNDLAQSLQSKVMQFAIQEFWSHWYWRYRRYTKKGDEKVATITGVKGMTFEKIDLGDVHTKYPPGVLIYSAKEAEYKELVLRRDLMQMYPQFQMSMPPDGMRNFNKYVFFPKFLSDPSLIDLMLPNTIDEIKAEEENNQLDKDELPKVAETDNHEQHLYIHRMAKKTWATWTHIAWHEELLAQQMAVQKAQMDMQAQAAAQGQSPAQPEVGADKGNPQKAAASLEREANSPQSMIR